MWRSTKRKTEHGACVYMLQVEKYHSVCILPGCGLELQQGGGKILKDISGGTLLERSKTAGKPLEGCLHATVGQRLPHWRKGCLPRHVPYLIL